MKRHTLILRTLLVLSLLIHATAHTVPLPDSWDKKETLADARSSEHHQTDPLEPLNRGLFVLHRLLDGMFLKPLAELYTIAIPTPIRQGVGNVLGNLVAPLHALNFSLQGKGQKAGSQLFRFMVNSTIGLLGLFDVASHIGFSKEETTFGKTFASWGVPSGPYLIIPGYGPSDVRDAVGRVLQIVLDPFNRVVIHEGERSWMYWRMGVQTIHTRSQNIKSLEAIEHTSPDYYEGLREFYQEANRPKTPETKGHYSGPKPDDSWK